MKNPKTVSGGAWVRPFVENLFKRLGESVHLVVSAGSDVRFIDGMEGDQPLRIGPRTGALMPAYCTSGGKAMLADLDWGDIEAWGQRGLRPWPHARIRDLRALRRSWPAGAGRATAPTPRRASPV